MAAVVVVVVAAHQRRVPRVLSCQDLLGPRRMNWPMHALVVEELRAQRGAREGEDRRAETHKKCEQQGRTQAPHGKQQQNKGKAAHDAPCCEMFPQNLHSHIS